MTFRGSPLLCALSSLALLLLLPAAAIAQSVEPDHFADGQDISNAVPGVTLSTPGNGGSIAVYAVTDPFSASTGQNVFGYLDPVSNTLDTRWHQQTFPLQADFSTPVMSVSLDFIMGFPVGGLVGKLIAFDIFNNQIDMVMTPADQNGVTTLTVSSAIANISRIQAMYEGGSADAGGLDNMVVIVPEPGTASLLALALLGGAALRKRRSR